MIIITSRSGFYWILEAVLSSPIDCLWTNVFITLIFVFSIKAAEFTVTLGQAFDLAYKRYIAKGKQESKDNREVLDLKKQVEQAKAENDALRQKLNESVNHESRRSESVNSNGSEGSLLAVPAVKQVCCVYCFLTGLLVPLIAYFRFYLLRKVFRNVNVDIFSFHLT